MSTQAPSQAVSPFVQSKPQLPILQVALALVGASQAVPHFPQFRGSVLRFRQASEQAVRPPSHFKAQAPFSQLSSESHALAHAPQFSLSLFRLRQVPLQLVSAGAQVGGAPPLLMLPPALSAPPLEVPPLEVPPLEVVPPALGLPPALTLPPALNVPPALDAPPREEALPPRG